jgi:hypothetical protein
MAVTVTDEEVAKIVDRERGREIIKQLDGLGPAAAMLTTASILATLVTCSCDSLENSEYTLDELNRLMKQLIKQVDSKKQSGSIQ